MFTGFADSGKLYHYPLPALGISVVVPAKKILDIIEQPAFVEQRERDEQTFLEQMGTTSTT